MLSQYVNPYRLAETHFNYIGILNTESWLRLRQFVEDYGTVSLNIRFWKDEEQRARLGGTLEAEVVMICQRCLENFNVQLSQELAFVVLKDEAMIRRTADELDAWVADSQANIYELLEDELILSIPIIAKHPANTCRPPKFHQQIELERDIEDLDRQMPFKHLKDLLKN